MVIRNSGTRLQEGSPASWVEKVWRKAVLRGAPMSLSSCANSTIFYLLLQYTCSYLLSSALCKPEYAEKRI